MNEKNEEPAALTTSKQLVRFNQIWELCSSIFAAIVFFAVGVGLCIFFSKEETIPLVAYAFPLLCFVVPIYGFFYNVILVKRRNPHNLKSGPKDPYQGTDMLATQTAQPYTRTVESSNLEVVAWFGPAGRIDMKGLNRTLLGKEYVNGAENTILLTKDQLVALALIQSDFDAQQIAAPDSSVGKLLDFAAQASTTAGTASGQQTNLQVLQMSNWPTVIENLKREGLARILPNHFNFSIPFADIARIEPKARFFNPSVYIHLHNGATLKYTTFQQSAVERFVEDAKTLGLNIS